MEEELSHPDEVPVKKSKRRRRKKKTVSKDAAVNEIEGTETAPAREKEVSPVEAAVEVNEGDVPAVKKKRRRRRSNTKKKPVEEDTVSGGNAIEPD